MRNDRRYQLVQYMLQCIQGPRQTGIKTKADIIDENLKDLVWEVNHGTIPSRGQYNNDSLAQMVANIRTG